MSFHNIKSLFPFLVALLHLFPITYAFCIMLIIISDTFNYLFNNNYKIKFIEDYVLELLIFNLAIYMSVLAMISPLLFIFLCVDILDLISNFN